MAPNEIPVASSSSRKNKKYSRIFPDSDGDDIVVSGMAGKFPNSRNVSDYEYNLYNKIDMVDDEETRWKHFNPEIPQRSGKISDLEKFDATFFGVHFKQAHTMDPQCRILIESAYEAILDAGVSPKSLRGTRTGVYIGACISESEKTWFYEKISSGGFGITGCSRAMLSNRISYVLGLNGPSYLIDTACSSSMFALDNAFSAFRNGEIDAAIIGGANLSLHPYVTLQFARLGVLAANGFCRPFDQDATGYTRSEAVNCLFLQRKRDALRIYGTLVYSKTNCDGYKPEGITYPSGVIQEQLLREFYNDVDVSPKDIGYLEAHSTGTVVGDPEECRAIDNVICKERDEPLLVGSVKSNIGHSEAASGICSLVKILLAFQTGKIPPNINFKTVRKEIPALAEGRLKVVSEVEELSSPYIGVNSFGFGGANAHALFRAHKKEKTNHSAPSDNLPRLVQWSSRTEDGLNIMLDSIEANPLDTEYIGLLQNIQRESISGFVFRGYGLFSHVEEGNAQCLNKEVQHYTGVQRPIVWVFSGMGSQWSEMGTSLMSIPIFRESIYRCHNALIPKGLDLINIITSPDPTAFDNILNSFVGIAAIQIALVDILKMLDFEPDFMIGHSVGELGCAYADGGFTAEQMILAAYSRGKVSLEIEKIRGSMAAIGLSYKQVVQMLPPTIEVACHNSAESSTISGPEQDVAKFVAELKSKNIFAKEVPCSNIAYHSRYISQMGPILLKYLNEIIPNPQKRSAKWLSTSVPKNQWDQPESQLCSSEYHTNNLLSAVLFEETATLLPQNALTVEIAPHGLLQAILKKSMPNAVNIPLTNRGNKNSTQFFLSALGKIYVNGADLPIDRLYPSVNFPVSRGTKNISSLIRWDHSEDWFVSKFENIKCEKTGERSFVVGLKNDDDEFLAGHIIDGKILVPATYYLQIVWETFSLMTKGPVYMDLPVEFEDVRFLRATHLTKESSVTLIVMIHYATGNFEITDNDTIVASGTIREIMNPKPPAPVPELAPSKHPLMETRDFYKELRLRGYHYAGVFRGVQQARSDGLRGNIKWAYNWVSFMDCLLQIYIIGSDSRSLLLPTRIQKLRILGTHHMELLSGMDLENQFFEVQVDKRTKRLIAGGVELIGVNASPISRRRPPGLPVLEQYKFLPHFPAPVVSNSDAIRICVQLALENNAALKIKVVEVDLEKTEPIIPLFQEALDDLPLVTGDLMFLSQQELELSDIHIEDGKLSTQTNCMFVVATNVLAKPEFIDDAKKSLNDKGFLVTKESIGLRYDQVQAPVGFTVIGVFPTEDAVFVLMQQIARKMIGSTLVSPVAVKISQKDANFSWIQPVQAALAAGPVVLVAQNEELNGLIGLVNCLRKEPDGTQVTCVFIDDPRAPPFDLELPFYDNQLKRGMAINVYRNGEWGTYRHLQLTPVKSLGEPKRAAYVNQVQRGDLSSLAWLETATEIKDCAIKVVYAPLNFRDIMLATGRITLETYESTRLENQCVLGFEIAGITRDGKRIMGVVGNGAIATHIKKPTYLLWEVPSHWSLKEAATVPCVYLTVYLAFFLVCDIREGKRILIHAGSGGIGQSAIRVALAYGLEVFTTVGTKQKKDFLLETFPQLKESNIGNSRDTSFEKMIAEQTDGQGVDFVLNSLAEDKLLASIRCLGSKGHFLEIGKFDISNDSKIGLGAFVNELSFHAIFADRLFYGTVGEVKKVKDLITKDIKSGIIQPLTYTVFPSNEVEQAFRYMASGKHIGKVLIQVHEETPEDKLPPIEPLQQLYFDADLVYIIPGGLGGFGLELADWMILRGARKIVLSSSKGISKPYQDYRIRLWERYGTMVEVRTDDITTYEGCKSLISSALKLGQVGGIFNLAVVLRDAIFANQTAEKFTESLAPKAISTKYLDELSRKMCPLMQYFVVFSSVSCGRGNAGQTNYGMANSVMERIIEKRASEGLPAKAIQWGAVGEVGLVADMAEDKIDMEIGGTLQQRISSCLQVLDSLLSTPDALVSSMVVAEKRRASSGNIIETVMNIMGIRDLKSVSMGSSLSEMGMDSLMAVEIKQTLERDFELFLSPQDLRSLTFQKLQEYTESREKDSAESVKLRLAREDIPTGMVLLLRHLGDELNSRITMLPLITKNSNLVGMNPTLIVPGLEGVAGQAWYNIGQSLHSPSFILQLANKGYMTTIEEITSSIYENAAQVFKKNQPFYLIGYSFGSLVTMELAHRLEAAGYKGHIMIIDGGLDFLKKLGNFGSNYTLDEMQVMLLTITVHSIFPDQTNESLAAQFSKLPDWNSRLNRFLELCENQNVYSKEYGQEMMNAMYNRLKIVVDMSSTDVKPLKSSITLIRPSDVSVHDIDEDYELSKYTSGKITVKFIEGNHTTILDNPRLPQLINSCDPNIDDEKCFESLIR